MWLNHTLYDGLCQRGLLAALGTTIGIIGTTGTSFVGSTGFGTEVGFGAGLGITTGGREGMMIGREMTIAFACAAISKKGIIKIFFISFQSNQQKYRLHNCSEFGPDGERRDTDMYQP